MNKRDHVLNGVLVGGGLGYLLRGSVEGSVAFAVIGVGVPVVLGALLPDVDTAFGTHRKTLHNLPVLVGFIAFPAFFGNLQYVWVGVLSHYILDLLGTRRGLALLYPWPREFGLPFGVTVDSILAPVVMLAVTALELAAIAAVLAAAPEIRGVVADAPLFLA